MARGVVTIEGLQRDLDAALYRYELVRAEVLAAEAAVERDRDSVPRRFHAIGLRRAALLLGLPEGEDPVTRRRNGL